MQTRSGIFVRFLLVLLAVIVVVCIDIGLYAIMGSGRMTPDKATAAGTLDLAIVTGALVVVTYLTVAESRQALERQFAENRKERLAAQAYQHELALRSVVV